MNQPRQFRHRPTGVWAMQFDGSYESADAIERWSGGLATWTREGKHSAARLVLTVETQKGQRVAVRGYWIVKYENQAVDVFTADAFGQSFAPMNEP